MYLPINKYDILLTLIFMQKNVERMQMSVVYGKCKLCWGSSVNFFLLYTRYKRKKEEKEWVLHVKYFRFSFNQEINVDSG